MPLPFIASLYSAWCLSHAFLSNVFFCSTEKDGSSIALQVTTQVYLSTFTYIYLLLTGYFNNYYNTNRSELLHYSIDCIILSHTQTKPAVYNQKDNELIQYLSSYLV
jgi:hypothetical protein